MTQQEAVLQRISFHRRCTPDECLFLYTLFPALMKGRAPAIFQEKKCKVPDSFKVNSNHVQGLQTQSDADVQTCYIRVLLCFFFRKAIRRTLLIIKHVTSFTSLKNNTRGFIDPKYSFLSRESYSASSCATCAFVNWTQHSGSSARHPREK
jgi:hypothetical protein